MNELHTEFYQAGTRGMDRNLLVVCSSRRHLEPISAFGISLMRMSAVADAFNLEDDNNIIGTKQTRAEIALRNTLERDTLAIRDICAVNSLEDAYAERLVNILRLKRANFDKSATAGKNLNTPEFEFLSAFNKNMPAKHFSRWEYASIFAQFYCPPNKGKSSLEIDISNKMSAFILTEESQQHISHDKDRANNVLNSLNANLSGGAKDSDLCKDAPTREIKRITEMYLTTVSKFFTTAPATAVKLKTSEYRSNEQENPKPKREGSPESVARAA
jgi:hypothetical protein